MTVEAIKFTKAKHRSKLCGYADLRISVQELVLEVRGCPVFCDGDQIGVGLPSSQWVTSDGKRAYSPILRIDGDAYNTFTELARTAVMPFVAQFYTKSTKKRATLMLVGG